MNRKFFYNRDCKLSYIDFGGEGKTIIALHGHFGCANMYVKLGNEIPELYRLIALDQQGHGFSDWGINYTRDEYISDILALYNELEIENAIIIGHSLGGVNAYQFAARYPSKVKALIIEDTGAFISNDQSSAVKWPKCFNSLVILRDFLTDKGISNTFYFMESLVRTGYGWGFLFDTEGLIKSQLNLNGNWLADWENIRCNTLLMRGEDSEYLSADHAKQITKDRDNMALIEFSNCGHTIRDDNFDEFKNTILDFLIIIG